MKEFYEKYQGYFPAAFFIGGFLFDLLTTDRIDQSFSLIQQLVYLILLMIFVYWEVITPEAFKVKEKFLGKLWAWHVEVLHFLFGSLLSLYTIFYFKSASLMTSFIFMGLLAVVLVINELPQFQKLGITMRFAMLALCLVSYFIYLVPVMTGAIGILAFIIAIALSVSLFLLLVTQVNKKMEDKDFVKKRILLPGLVVNISFVLLYFFKVLPPVPISIKFIGIYHDIQKSNGQFALNYERDWWRFWQSGAQTFVKREGDKVYCFVSIFSPAQFSEKLNLVWMKHTVGGWSVQDTIPLAIRGGRDQGYRGYAVKSNYENGDWQIRVVTSDAREVGRISFTISDADPSSQREWRQDTY
ncbi:MAG: DUF2914 domain-containing protein [Bdellovibrionales bacterium]|nr:DUF2914 domain-containing protein [Bdellovibrionales bacterium]NQZ19308.1 DUF2914 domain-containing protein [Bdellovibrionales bacterium]